jgi:hypothetical protein
MVNVHADGAYLVDPASGREIPITGAIVVANADGSLTLRLAPADNTVVVAVDPNQAYDMTNFARLVIAVVRGGLTIAQIQAVRPGVATLVQTYLTNNGLTPGAVG